MKTKHIVYLLSLFFILALSFAFVSHGVIQGSYFEQASQNNIKAGDLSGAMMADLSNINYTDLGTALSLNGFSAQDRSGSVDRMLVRGAFSIRSAVILMDAHDQMWFERTGQVVFTGVPYTHFSSATLEDYAGYFSKDSQTNRDIKAFDYAGDTDGDIGSNGTLNEDSYGADLTYKHFDTADYDGVNVTETENLNTAYSDLTEDLLETDEDEDEYKGESNDLVVAGFTNLEGAIQDIMQKRIGQILSKPSTQIRIDNYTLSALYHEQVMSDSLADLIIEAYDDAKSSGFLSNFQAKSPLKFSKLTSGVKMDAWKSINVQTPNKKTFSGIRGMTNSISSLAFKNSIVKGSVSSLTGLTEKARTGWNTVTGWGSSLKTGTQKLLSGPISWFNGLKSRFGNIIKWVVIVIILVLVAYILMQFTRLSKLRNRM